MKEVTDAELVKTIRAKETLEVRVWEWLSAHYSANKNPVEVLAHSPGQKDSGLHENMTGEVDRSYRELCNVATYNTIGYNAEHKGIHFLTATIDFLSELVSFLSCKIS